MTTSHTVLTNFAERLLASGRDRIAHRFDKRRAHWLSRNGLLSYQDGTYSLSVSAMESALLDVRAVLTDPHMNPARRAELTEMVRRGHEFCDRHRQIHAKRFESLTAAQYAALWSLSCADRQRVFHAPEMSQREVALWTALQRAGFVSMLLKGQTMFIAPLAAGDQLVARLGNPYFAAA